MNNSAKEWSDIIGYEGRYEIRTTDTVPYAEVRNKITQKNKTISLYGHKGREYFAVFLYGNINGKIKGMHKTIHRLVAIQYIPNPYGKKVVNHKNGIKSDNRIRNLEWTSAYENYLHAKNNNLLDESEFKTGENNHGYKGAIEIYKDGKLIQTLKGMTALENFGLSSSKVYDCLRGQRKSHKGYIFKRVQII
jgi:hypothetical protein